MRNSITIVDAVSGNPETGHTVKLYAYSTGSSGYSGSALYTYTDNGDGSYYADVTTTIKGTLVITKPTGVVIVPSNYLGSIFQGDNQPTIQPGGST